MKYGMWLDEWFSNYIQPLSKIKTCERYSEIIEKHLKVKLGEYELDELPPLVLQRYVTGVMQSGRNIPQSEKLKQKVRETVERLIVEEGVDAFFIRSVFT